MFAALLYSTKPTVIAGGYVTDVTSVCSNRMPVTVVKIQTPVSHTLAGAGY